MPAAPAKRRTGTASKLDISALKRHYRDMLLIRRFEEKAGQFCPASQDFRWLSSARAESRS